MAAVPTTSIIFCGQLDATSLGAVSLANSVINVTCLAVGMGLATACDTLFSQSRQCNKSTGGATCRSPSSSSSPVCRVGRHLNTEALFVSWAGEEIAGSMVLRSVSASYGSDNKTLVGDYLQKSLLILALACLPCWAVHLNTEALLRLLGQDEEIAR
ncbi:hypothetical protein NP493_17g04003 [Ridgeia piscesae]|uniref:Uncharacterized protein n=1 Tax=Ridgeia piscesae TaxID=27915 RepID=A0AAD9PDY6_RIDPI|nr:hypothetical protein NP493_17g04003 [Ridgeia piscesae]